MLYHGLHRVVQKQVTTKHQAHQQWLAPYNPLVIYTIAAGRTTAISQIQLTDAIGSVIAPVNVQTSSINTSYTYSP